MKKLKRILAWIGIIVLLGLYLTTFLLGILGKESTRDLLLASIICTVVVPVLLYAMLLAAKVLSNSKKKDADGRKR